MLAVDEVAGYRGSFQFGADEHGEWVADVVFERRALDGGWDELGSGGCHGVAWQGHERPHEGWDGRVLGIMGKGGMDVVDEVGDDEVIRPLLVVYGFAAGCVTSVGLTGPVESRDVAVSSTTGAFAVVLLGEGQWTLTPRLDDGGTGPAEVVHLS